MAKTGRPKSENVKKKVLSIRVEDSMYKRICDYAGKHKNDCDRSCPAGTGKNFEQT
ncbi:MAG: hypothetical protein ACLUUO_19845 [Sellimonas intestinalis]